MDLFEYQGKQYFARYDIPVPDGAASDTVEDAVASADRIGYPVVIKAQVQVGGRGKAGGIKLANNADEARLHAGNILGMDIKGHTVRRLWVETASDIAEEYYASYTLNRSKKQFLGMLSARGGVEIELVAKEASDAIATIDIDPTVGLSEGVVRDWVARARLNPAATEGAVSILLQLYTCFTEGDCDLAEINPLILSTDGRVYALDAKVTLDDAAAHRHPEWDAYRGLAQMDEREALAKEKGLQYIGLDGDVGIIANGAGLAMSTLDTVQQVGGSGANFRDIGGGADAEVVANALNVINSDDKVKAILINIFGGITRCDEVARGIIEALNTVTLRAPLVVRLDGTNAAEGRALLATVESDRVISEATMLSAARRAVQIAQSAPSAEEGA